MLAFCAQVDNNTKLHVHLGGIIHWYHWLGSSDSSHLIHALLHTPLDIELAAGSMCHCSGSLFRASCTLTIRRPSDCCLYNNTNNYQSHMACKEALKTGHGKYHIPYSRFFSLAK